MYIYIYVYFLIICIDLWFLRLVSQNPLNLLKLIDLRNPLPNGPAFQECGVNVRG